MYFSPFTKQNKAEVWLKLVEASTLNFKVLNESRYSMLGSVVHLAMFHLRFSSSSSVFQQFVFFYCVFFRNIFSQIVPLRTFSLIVFPNSVLSQAVLPCIFAICTLRACRAFDNKSFHCDLFIFICTCDRISTRLVDWFYIIAGFLPLKWHTWKRKEIIDVSSYVTIWWNTRLSKIMRIQKRNKLFGKGKVLVRDYDHNMTIIINLSWYWHIGKMWDVTSVTDGRGWKVGWFTRFRKWSSPGCLT